MDSRGKYSKFETNVKYLSLFKISSFFFLTVVGGDNINIEDAPFQLYLIIRMSLCKYKIKKAKFALKSIYLHIKYHMMLT